ncbi:sulfite exporter TauE/SafE family protein [Desulfococcus sp.]|uniref:sulfite exporter TauE/SafE family protein n=1 Tax=Desulfococcus sp. TaxID=2025834 RepID=UPI0035931046
MSSTELPAAFLFFLSTGLAVGFGHCIGMCGPIVVAMGLKSPAKALLLPHLLYTAGRIVTYALLGGIVGATGAFTGLAAQIAGVQKAVMILTGFLIILTGLAMGGWLPLGRMFRSASPEGGIIARGYQRLARAPLRPGTCFPLGLLLGLLPCGPVYTALLAAARLAMAETHPAAGFLTGALAMAAFGLGTFPALMLVARMSSVRWIRSRALVYRAAAMIVIVFGAVFVYQGLCL